MSRQDEQKLIREFGELMQQKLDERSHKGRLGWRNKDINTLLQWLDEEVAELKLELKRNPEEAKRECADIANVAMFINDYFVVKG